MARRTSRRKKKRRILPALLLSMAAGSLATLAMVYTPGGITREAEERVAVLFHLNDSTPPPDTIFIRVLNGVGVPDLASRAQNFLETRTGDAVIYAPGPPADAARRDYATTVVLAHDTTYSAALVIAGYMELGDSSVVMLLPEPGILPEVDVTVILGRDRDDPSFYIPYRE